MCILTVSAKLCQWFFTRAYIGCVLRQRQLLHTLQYTHTSMAGEIVICQKNKPYLPNFTSEFRPVYAGGVVRGGSNKPPFWLTSGFCQITQAHKKRILIETTLHHKLCSMISNEVHMFIHKYRLLMCILTVSAKLCQWFFTRA